MKSGFSFLDHPADMGFSAWAESMPELFATCAKALTSTLVDFDSLSQKTPMAIEVQGDDLETLMFNWLSEILYLFDAERMFFSEYTVTRLENQNGVFHLHVDLQGEAFDQTTHQVKTYVKAITFHQLQIKQIDDRFQAQVYLDI